MESDQNLTSNSTPSFQIPRAYIRYISFLEFLSFRLSSKAIQKRFFTPIPFKTPRRELSFLAASTQEVLKVGKKQITLNSMGEGDKTVLFIHGWSGRGSQAYAIAPELVKQGYRFVAITAQAHGSNPGKRTHMLQFADAITAAQNHLGKIHTLMAHSIGGAAAINAVTDGVGVQKLVILGAPSSISDVITDFCEKLELDDRYVNYLKDYLHTHYHSDFESLSPRRKASELSDVEGLIIHDKQDIDVHYTQAEALHRAWQGSHLILTEGLGHRRVLSDENVIEQLIDFVRK